MFMPTIFHENLFDDFFDPFWNDGALERAMNREERETFGKRGANMMKTDVKQTTDGSYDVAVDLPGCKKILRAVSIAPALLESAETYLKIVGGASFFKCAYSYFFQLFKSIWIYKTFLDRDSCR